MNITTLKIIALVAMLIDHIGLYIVGMPIWFRWIGRLAIPVFIFCLAVGFKHTSNRKNYILRLYGLNIIVTIVNIIFNQDQNFIRTLCIIAIIYYIIHLFEVKDKNRYKVLWAFIIYELGISTIIFILCTKFGLSDWMQFVLLNIPLTILQSELFFVIFAVFIYIFQDNKKMLCVTFIIGVLSYIGIYNTDIIYRGINKLSRLYGIDASSILNLLGAILSYDFMFVNNNMLWGDCQWMMIGALPLLLLYNGEKGKGYKWLFYVFYPVHLIAIFGIAKIFNILAVH